MDRLGESNFRERLPIGFAKIRKQSKATLAQLVERLIRNQQVAGSSPAGGSIFLKIGLSTSPCRAGFAAGRSMRQTRSPHTEMRSIQLHFSHG